MMRVLVTGATGLIGRHAVAALGAQGIDVHGLARHAPDMPSAPGVTWHTGDLLQDGVAEAIAAEVQVTHLLHLAWVTEHGAFWEAPQNRAWRDASHRLIEAFQAHGGRRVVMAGTCAEYDWTDLGDGVCREGATPVKPHTLYGRMKAETHDWLAAFAARMGLDYAWGRVFFLYGAGEDDKRLVPAVARALCHGEEAKCSSGTPVRDFMDARDVGAAFAALLLSDVRGAVNIASGEGHAIADVVRMLAGIVQRPDLVRLGALPDRDNEPPVLVADVTRLRDEVGFVPRIGLSEGLRDVCARFNTE